MRRHVPEEIEDALARLAQRVDGLAQEFRALGPLRTTVQSQGRALTQLADAITALGGTTDTSPGGSAGESGGTAALPDLPPAPEWLSVADPELAVTWLTDLLLWVPEVWERYPNGQLTACWPWHPTVVAELLVSQHLWAAAAAPGMPADPLAVWHDRWRPSAAVRVSRSLTGCDRGAGCHVNPGGHHYRYDLGRLNDLAAWWATSTRDDLDAAPGLQREDHHDRYEPMQRGQSVSKEARW